jgi:ADP-ribosylglycohydrolase
MKSKHSRYAVSLADRVRGALWGGLVGDAFCLGSHWIYSIYEISQRYPDGIKGFEAPLTGHYHYGKQSGDFSHYGDAALVMLTSIAERGRFEAADFGAHLIGLMGDDNYTGYRDHATKGMLANYHAHMTERPDVPFDYQQGADDDQPATVTHLAPVVAAHVHDPDLLDVVERTTRVCQNNDRAVAFAKASALILRHLLEGCTPEAAVVATRLVIRSPSKTLMEVNKRMKVACAARILTPIDATILFGQSCPLYSSFTAALHTTLVCEDDFGSAIIASANAGGDNAARSAMVGAWLGAYHGIAGIPEAWRARLNAADLIEAAVEKIVANLVQQNGGLL